MRRPLWPNVRRPPNQSSMKPRPYRLGAPTLTLWDTSSISPRDCGVSTDPAYRAWAQIARSRELEAIAPAWPAAVVTDVNGAIAVPSDWLIHRRLVPQPCWTYAVATAARRGSIPCTNVLDMPSGVKNRRRSSDATEWPVTFSTTWPRRT